MKVNGSGVLRGSISFVFGGVSKEESQLEIKEFPIANENFPILKGT